MSDSQQAHPGAEAPETDPEIDPEIEELLKFEPAPRKREVAGAWTPELQREFIARLAVTGSPGRASEEMGKTDTGVRKLYRSPEAASFRGAWDKAVEIAKRRKAARAEEEQTVVPGSRPPSLDHRRKHRPAAQDGPLPGQILNEYGEWEGEDSIRRRVEDVRDRMTGKLLRARRHYLQEISGSPGKRAAFEILTALPIDWDKARRGEAQPDEPYRRISMRKPDMLLTVENGWLGEVAIGGEDKKAELMKAIDDYRAKKGLEPVEWDEPDEAPGALST